MKKHLRATGDMEVTIAGYSNPARRRSFMEQCTEAAIEHASAHLPQDPESIPSGVDNHDRAGWAKLALQTFAIATGSDLEDAVADLIADLAHFCDRHGLKLSDEIERGEGHYLAETNDKGTQFYEH